jgi:hypothetical protein
LELLAKFPEEFDGGQAEHIVTNVSLVCLSQSDETECGWFRRRQKRKNPLFCGMTTGNDAVF